MAKCLEQVVMKMDQARLRCKPFPNVPPISKTENIAKQASKKTYILDIKKNLCPSS